jgi:hypothetical protein
MRVCFLVAVLAVVVSAKRAEIQRKQEVVPMDFGTLPVTMGEIMAKIEEQAPIDDILAECHKLQENIRSDNTTAWSTWQNFDATYCTDLPNQLVDIQNAEVTIAATHESIAAINASINALKDNVAVTRTAITTLEQGIINNNIPQMEQLEQDRIEQYHKFNHENEVLTWALSALEEIRIALVEESKLQVSSFAERKAAVTAFIEAKATQASSDQKEMLNRVAQGVSKAGSIADIFQMVYSLRADLSATQDDLQLNEANAYETFTTIHKEAREAVNAEQKKIEDLKTAIAQDLYTVAAHVVNITDHDHELSVQQKRILKASDHYAKGTYECTTMKASIDEEMARYNEEDATLTELIYRLNQIQFGDYAQTVADRVTLAPAPTPAAVSP